VRRLPRIVGAPIRVRFSPGLRASRGRLASSIESHGARWAEIHAGTYVRSHCTIVDSALLADQRELTRILLHELFHYVWARLGNAARQSFEDVLLAERAARARGELGWSSELHRQYVREAYGRCWREYVCEAFCDTAAWHYSRIPAHGEFTLAARFRRRRASWFASWFGTRSLRV
jgi:hypothetical protein